MNNAKFDIRSLTVLISLCMIYFTAMVLGAGYGDKPGVTMVSPANNAYATSSPVTLNCSASDAYASLDNLTLYFNYTSDNTFLDRTKVTMVTNETLVADDTLQTALYSNFTTFTIDNNMTLFWTCYACNNVTNCTWGANYSVKGELSPTAPYATVTTDFVTDDNKVVYSNSVVINVSAGTDRADVGIANITIYYNITDVSTFNNWSNNGTDIWRELPQTDWTSSGLVNDFESLSATFVTDNFTTADKIIYYYAYACSNATIVHCDYTSGNQTLTYKYVAEETTVPTFGNVYTDWDGYGGNVTFGTNGTTDYDGTVYLGITTRDNVNLATVRIYTNMTNGSYIGPDDILSGEWFNNGSVSVSGTESVALFNFTGLLTDGTLSEDEGWLAWKFEACDNATTANCANSSKYIMYVDRRNPTVSTLANVTDKSECKQVNVTITSDEVVNYTLLWGSTSGALTETLSSSSYALTHEIIITPTPLPYTNYYYNYTICDAGAQCYSSGEYPIRTGLPLCNGWSTYALLNTYDLLGNIGSNITAHADNVSVRYWNQTSQSYLQWNDGYATNENVTVYKRDALEIWVSEDTMVDDAWWEEQGNSSNSDDSIIFLAEGWNEMPILTWEGKSFYNFTLAGAIIADGFVNNATYGSWFNSTSKKHRSWALNQTINENMTLIYPTATWLYMVGNYTYNINGSIDFGPNDGSWS